MPSPLIRLANDANRLRELRWGGNPLDGIHGTACERYLAPEFAAFLEAEHRAPTLSEANGRRPAVPSSCS